MKITFANLAVIVLATISGCSQGTAGGPGTTDSSVKKPTFGQTDDTFNLSVPVMSSALQQGEKIEATIGIKRAKNFDEDVAIRFADVPKGVTIEPNDSAIKHGDTDAKITFHASDEAAVGEFKVKVIGHPTKGGDAEVDFKLTVAAKDSFSGRQFQHPSEQSVRIHKRSTNFAVAQRFAGGDMASSNDRKNNVRHRKFRQHVVSSLPLGECGIQAVLP